MKNIIVNFQHELNFDIEDGKLIPYNELAEDFVDLIDSMEVFSNVTWKKNVSSIAPSKLVQLYDKVNQVNDDYIYSLNMSYLLNCEDEVHSQILDELNNRNAFINSAYLKPKLTTLTIPDFSSRQTFLDNDSGTRPAYQGQFINQDISLWEDIVEIIPGKYLMMGRKADGTILCSGFSQNNGDGTYTYNSAHTLGGLETEAIWKDVQNISTDWYCVYGNIGNTLYVKGVDYWSTLAGATNLYTNVRQIFYCTNRVAVLKNDGTVVCSSEGTPVDTSTWTNIVDIAHTWWGVIGLKSNGDVVQTSYTGSSASSWHNVIKIKGFSSSYIIGLDQNGLMKHNFATGTEYYSQLRDWLNSLTDVVDFDIFGVTVIVVKSNGTALYYDTGVGTPVTLNWTNVTKVYAGNRFAAGLQSDGKVLTHNWVINVKGANIKKCFPITRGAGIKTAIIEFTYTKTHRELTNVINITPETYSDWNPEDVTEQDYTDFRNHGTATLGIVGAKNDGEGTVGIAPESTLYFSSTVNGIPEAILKLIEEYDFDAGDVISMSIGPADPTYGTLETWYDCYQAVKYATLLGITVCIAAGNDAANLDDLGVFDVYPGAFNPYLPQNDSGSLIIGAGSESRSILSFSNYGSRVNVQNRGDHVTTIGYADLYENPNNYDEDYTQVFNGTSAATPITAGGVALIQSYRKMKGMALLTPLEIRNEFITKGFPQIEPIAKHIGPMPNVYEVLSTTPGFNLLPIVGTDAAETIANKPVTINVLSNDVELEDGELTLTSVTQGTYGNTSITDNQTIEYLPINGYVGTDQFTYTVKDNKNALATATVTVTIEEPTTEGPGPDPEEPIPEEGEVNLSRVYAQRKTFKTGSTTVYKDLSDNNFTDSEKEKLSNISGAVTGFTIAPSDAANKDNADLVLTGVPADDCAAINEALINLIRLDKTIHSGATVVGSGLYDIRLGNEASTNRKDYKGCYIIINGETRVIKDYNYSQKILNLSTPLSAAPLANVNYVIKDSIGSRVDFLPGTIDLGNGTINVETTNFKYYGNGVKIKSTNAVAAIQNFGSDNLYTTFNFDGSGISVGGDISYCNIDNITGITSRAISVHTGSIAYCNVGNLLSNATGIVIEEGYIDNCRVGDLDEGCVGYLNLWGPISNCSIGDLNGINCVGIDASMSYYKSINNVRIGNINGNGAYGIKGDWVLVIDNCYIGNITGPNACGILSSGAWNMISNCIIGNIELGEGSGSFGMYLAGGKVSNCTISSISGTGDIYGILNEGGTIENCYIGNVEKGCAIALATGDVRGCTFGNIGVGCEGINNVGNGTIYNCNFGVISGMGITVANVRVSNCFMLGVDSGGNGIYINGTYNNVISNNSIETLTTVADTGIYVAGQNCLITGNIVGTLNGGTAISITGTNTIKKNNIEGTGNYVA